MPFGRCVPKPRLTAITIILSIGAATTAYADTDNIRVVITKENGRPLAGVSMSLNLAMAKSIELPATRPAARL